VNNIQTNQAKRAFFGALYLPADGRLALHPERLERKKSPGYGDLALECPAFH
jgi:hypothetical protein